MCAIKSVADQMPVSIRVKKIPLKAWFEGAGGMRSRLPGIKKSQLPLAVM